MKTGKKKYTAVFVFNDSYHQNLRFILYTAPIFVFSFGCLFDAERIYRIAFMMVVPCVLGGIFLSSIVVFSNVGISCYQVFRKRKLIAWNDIQHSGTSLRSSWGTVATFTYFSTAKLSSPPKKALPPISNELVYLTCRSSLYDIISQYYASPARIGLHPAKTKSRTTQNNKTMPKEIMVSLAIMVILYRGYVRFGLPVLQILSLLVGIFAALRGVVLIVGQLTSR